MDWRDGQARRAWLDGLDAEIGNALAYYLGPALAPKVNALAGGAAVLSPGADFMDARSYGGETMNALASGDWMDAARGMGMTGAAMLGMALPGKASQVDDAVEGIRAFHGSPHDFDRFDMSKIGTGEGAQAYGHGLYFAESEGVARSYREALAGVQPFDLESISPAAHELLARDIGLFAGSRNATPDIVAQEAANFVTRGSPQPWLQADTIEALRAANLPAPSPGRMYEVRINANPDDFLDWDRPLSEQPERVREALVSRGYGVRPDWQKTETGWSNPEFGMVERDGADYVAKLPYGGGEIGRFRSPDEAISYLSPAKPITGSAIEDELGGAEQAATALREAGIPGIRYLDQGSRAAGDGSRNYVVFDDSLIEILRKYGLLGAVGLGGAVGMNALAQPEAEQY
jgi:hypothetical protein